VRLDRYEREPRRILLATFLWGAVIAALASSAANSGVHTWVARLAGEGSARALTPVLLAPAIEEIAKAGGLLLVLVVWPREFDNVLDGIVYGALVGVGFAMTENVSYFTLAAVQGGPAGFAQSVYLRALLGGFNHAAFSATMGAGLGYARAARSSAARILAPILGFLAALGQHVAWNVVASTRLADLLCSPAVPGGACRETPDPITLYLIVPLLVALSVGPGIAMLGFVATRALRREARARAVRPNGG
jgi:RsiW-degrading membrane proteinase PrsW (M82 family)